MRRLIFLLMMVLLPLPVLAQDATSEADKGYLTSFLERNLSGLGRTVSIDGFAGALSSRATFSRMTISDGEGVWLTINDGAIAWDRTALLSGRIEVKELSAASIDIPRAPIPEGKVSAEAKGFSLPELPVAVNIGAIRADKVSLGAPLLGQPAEVSLGGSMALEGGEGSTDLALNRIDGKMGEVTLKGSYSNATRQLMVDLLVNEGEGGLAATQLHLPGAPSLTLAVHGAGVIDTFKADVALSTDNQRRLGGSVQMTATPVEGQTDPQRGFHAELQGDVTPLFRPEYREFFGPDSRLVATGQTLPDGGFSLSELTIAARAMVLSGQAQVGADGVPLKADLSMTLGLPDKSELLLPKAGADTFLRSAKLHFAYDAAKGEDWRLDGSIAGFRRAVLQIRSIALAGAGSLGGATGAEAPRFNGRVSFEAAGMSSTDAALARMLGDRIEGRTGFAWVEGEPLTLTDVALSGAGIDLQGQGTITDPEKGAIIAGELSGKVADLSRFSGVAGRSLGGSAEVAARGSFTILGGAFDVTGQATGHDLQVEQPQADRLLAGTSRIALSVRRDTDGTEIRSLAVTANTLSLRAAGWLRSHGNDLTAGLSFADLSVLGPGFGGTLDAEAKLLTEGRINRLTVSGTGEGLKVGKAEVDGLLKGKSGLTLIATEEDRQIRVETFRLANPQVTVDGQGTLDNRSGQQHLTADLTLPDLGAMGGRYGGSLRATASVSGLSGARQFTLQGSGQNLRVGQAEADRLLGGAADLTLSARENRSTVLIEDLVLRTAQLQATAKGSDSDGRQQVDLSVKLANMGVLVPEFPGPAEISGTARDDGTGWQLDLAGRGPGETSATITGAIGASGRTDLAIRGNAQAGIANVFLGKRNIAGPVRFDLALKGQPLLADLSGRIDLPDLRITDPEQGIAVERVRASADLANGVAQVNATGAVAGGGEVSLSGPVTLSPPFDGTLAVELRDVRLRDPSLFDTTANGNLTVTGPLRGGAMIAGRITLGQTELRVPSTGFGGFADIEPIRHLAPPADVVATRHRAGLDGATGGGDGSVTGQSDRAFGLNIQIAAPNRIFVRGRGLDAELGGSVKLSGTTANVVPIGSFGLIRGRLSLLGKRFEITEGNVALEGAMAPYLHFVATTDNADISVSIVIDGPASSPTIHFTSSPSLPEEEVVSQLLFGRGLSSLSAFQAVQLASTVATLTGRGGDGLVSRLRSSFGLDDLDVQTGENGNLALKAGKYLTSNVYTDITVGGDGTTELNLNLDLSKHAKVRGTVEADGNTGIGVYFERDY